MQDLNQTLRELMIHRVVARQETPAGAPGRLAGRPALAGEFCELGARAVAAPSAAHHRDIHPVSSVQPLPAQLKDPTQV